MLVENSENGKNLKWATNIPLEADIIEGELNLLE